MLTLAVDIGGTKTRAAVLDPAGACLDQRSWPTLQRGPAGLHAELRSFGHTASRAIVGVPGRVDHRDGRLDHAPNLPAGWTAALSATALTDALGMPTRIFNDADLAALGEHRLGAGRGCDTMLYLTISTGIGAGVIVGGHLLHGRWSLAEVGHTVLHDGQSFEQLASGTALDTKARALGLTDSAALLAQRDRPEVAECWDRHLRLLVLGVRSAAFWVSPERIVIGGGLGLAAPGLLDAVRADLAEHGPPRLPTTVHPAELGDLAALYGAGMVPG